MLLFQSAPVYTRPTGHCAPKPRWRSCTQPPPSARGRATGPRAEGTDGPPVLGGETWGRSGSSRKPEQSRNNREVPSVLVFFVFFGLLAAMEPRSCSSRSLTFLQPAPQPPDRGAPVPFLCCPVLLRSTHSPQEAFKITVTMWGNFMEPHSLPSTNLSTSQRWGMVAVEASLLQLHSWDVGGPSLPLFQALKGPPASFPTYLPRD